jgi:uncharacterized protein (TIGR03085 family)
MEELGPAAPTLCEGWANYDMAAHLYVREHDPIAGVGIVVPPAERLHDQAIARTKERTPFEVLVRQVRSGPPLWWRPVDGLANVQEMFVHHEDVRRGGGDHTPRPASEIGALERRLWSDLRRTHWMVTRNIKGVRVVLEATDEAPIRAGRGDELVTITGRPGEIVLYLLGRRGAADVELSGSDDALAALAAAHLGI